MKLTISPKQISLCSDCAFTDDCSLRTNDSNVIQCEEYQTGLEKLLNHKTSATYTRPTNLIGLCNSCDHAKNCTLRTPSSIIFNCEHYQ